MTIAPRELTDVSSGPGRAEATHAVLDVALQAARHQPDDPFPEWRVRTLRRVRSLVAEECDRLPGPRPLEPEHVAAALDVCHGLSPTPHERVEYGAEHGHDHPNRIYGDVGTALRPFYGGEIPAAPDPDDE